MSDELLPLETLEERVEGEAAKRGARLLHFAVSPKRREVTILMELEDDLFLTDAQRAEREQFEEIERGFHQEAKEEKMAEAVRDLSELERKLADPDEGIL